MAGAVGQNAGDLANPNAVNVGNGLATTAPGSFGGGSASIDVADNTNANLQNAVATQTATAGMTQDQIAARQMQGVQASGQGQINNLASTMAQQSAGLGGQHDAGMQAAIANRQAKRYSSDINQLSQQAKLNAAGTQMQQQTAGMGAEAALEQQKQQLINAQMVKYQNDQAKSNQILSSVLSIGGAVAGAAAGAVAGPAGAALVGGATSAAKGMVGNTQQQQANTSGNGEQQDFAVG